jgi:hypothetical protein
MTLLIVGVSEVAKLWAWSKELAVVAFRLWSGARRVCIEYAGRIGPKVDRPGVLTDIVLEIQSFRNDNLSKWSRGV